MSATAKASPERPLQDLLRHTLIYGSGYVTLAVASTILVPVYTHHLTPSGYGLLGLMLVLYGLMSQIYDFGVTNSVARFFFDTPADDRREALLDLRVTSLAFMAAFGGALTLLLCVLAPQLSQVLTQSPHHGGLVRIVAVTLYAEGLATVPLTMIRMREQSRFFVVITVARFATTLGLSTLFVVAFRWGVQGALLGNAASGIAVLVVLAPEFRSAFSGTPSWQLLRRMMAFGLPFFPVILSAWFIDASDRYLLGIYRGHAQVGYYVLGYKVAQVMQIGVAAFMMGWAPLRYKIQERADAPEVYRQITSYYVLVAGFITVVVGLFAREIVAVLAPGRYAPAATIVPLIVLSYALYGLYVLMVTGMGIAKRTTPMAWVVGGAAAVNIGLNLVLIPRWGIRAAAVTTVLAYALMVLGGWYYSERVYPIPYDWPLIGRTFAVGALVSCAVLFLAPKAGIARMVVAAAGVLVFLALLRLTKTVGREDAAAARDLIRQAVRLPSRRPRRRPTVAVEGGGQPADAIDLRPFPFPYRAAIALCNDADLITPESFDRLRRFLNSPEETEWGPGLALETGGSFFMFRSPDSPNRFTVFDALSDRITDEGERILDYARSGLLDVLHTYGCFTQRSHFDRQLAERALDVLRSYDVKLKTWVNHGPPTNIQCVGDRPEWEGDTPGSAAYHADLTVDYGIRWLWTGAETTDSIARDPLHGDGRERLTLSQLHAPMIGFEGTNGGAALAEPYVLNDGQRVRRFYRYSGLSGYTPVLDDLPAQLSEKNLRGLIKAGGCAVVYQHLGVRRKRSGFGPSAYGPVGDAWFDRDELAALRRLAELHHAGDLWVTATTKLLRFRDARAALRWRATREDGQDVIVLTTAGADREAVSPEDLVGITFYCPAPETTRVYLEVPGDRHPRLMRTQVNPADETQRRSVTIGPPEAAT